MKKTPIEKFGRLAIALAVSVISIGSDRVLAQIREDNTLPVDSNVMPNGNTYEIKDGTQPGGGNNLFHSFEEFSVPTGMTAHFLNRVDIENIISRVTGVSISDIQGTIQANGTANLFLINPNGIQFGSSATLDIGGSFLATTATSMVFTDGTIFSAIAPQHPILTISVPIGLKFDTNSVGNISNQAQSLQVNAGESLTLLGGDVLLDGSGISSPGGQIAIGGLAAQGTVAIGSDGRLIFPEGVNRSDVALINAARINVRGNDGGSVHFYGRNVEFSGGSTVRAGINTGLGTENSRGGDIDVSATENAILTDSGTFLSNAILSGGKGRAGDVNITANSLSVTNSAQLFSGNLGEGLTGNINVNTRESILFDNAPINAAGGEINLQTLGEINLRNDSTLNVRSGEGGNIAIAANNLTLTNDSTIRAGIASGEGFPNSLAGDIDINLTGKLELSGAATFIANTVLRNGEGTGGDVNITAKSLVATEGAQIFTGSFGRGEVGYVGDINLSIQENVSLDGIGNQRSSGFISLIGNGVIGQTGDINLTAGSLSITNGAAILDSTFGQGNAGNINLNIQDRISLDGAGDGGNRTRFSSGIYNRVEANEAVGNAGQIQIQANSLAATNGAVISGSTQGRGNAGNIVININEDIILDGEEITRDSRRIQQSSGVFSSVKETGIGTSGRIEISATRLSITDGAVVLANTFGQGRGGNIQVNAEQIYLAGVGRNGQPSGILTPTQPSARGEAGQIQVSANSIQLEKGGVISSVTRNSGKGGNIEIQSNVFEVINGGQVLTSTISSGNAGNIVLDVSDRITIAGLDPDFASRAQPFGGDIVSSEGEASLLSASTSEDSTGLGGNLIVRSREFFLQDGAKVTVSANGSGNAGNLSISALVIDMNQGSITGESTSGEGGNLTITSSDLRVLNKSLISTTAGTADAPGNGGNITIISDFIVGLQNSDITANSFQGQGGKIDITAQGIFGLEFRENLTPLNDITAISFFNPRLNGTVNIQTPNINPTQGLTDIPVFENPEPIATVCRSRSTGSRELNLGGRGTPSGSEDPLSSSDDGLIGAIASVSSAGQPITEADRQPVEKGDRELLLARGWYVNNNGQLVLTENSTASIVQTSTALPQGCND